VVDEDLGLSGASVANRGGFARMTAEGTVTLLMVERVKTLNISIPDLCGKAIQL
jgi:hypothetical protein